jgi:hypothetical protein
MFAGIVDDWNGDAIPSTSLWLVEAILLERVLLDGRPQQKIVARLAAIDEDCADKPAARDLFWANADRKLGKLRRLSGTDILGIERELAKRIPIPATAYAATVRPSANPIREPHQPLRQALRTR